MGPGTIIICNWTTRTLDYLNCGSLKRVRELGADEYKTPRTYPQNSPLCQQGESPERMTVYSRGAQAPGKKIPTISLSPNGAKDFFSQ